MYGHFQYPYAPPMQAPQFGQPAPQFGQPTFTPVQVSPQPVFQQMPPPVLAPAPYTIPQQQMVPATPVQMAPPPVDSQPKSKGFPQPDNKSRSEGPGNNDPSFQNAPQNQDEWAPDPTWSDGEQSWEAPANNQWIPQTRGYSPRPKPAFQQPRNPYGNPRPRGGMGFGPIRGGFRGPRPQSNGYRLPSQPKAPRPYDRPRPNSVPK
jgi:hypothetical protein